MVLKKTLLLLLHSPSTSFFLSSFSVFPAATAAMAAKSYSHLKQRKREKKKKKCQNSDQSGNKTKHTHTKKGGNTNEKNRKGGIKK